MSNNTKLVELMTCRLNWITTDAEAELRLRPLREQWEARGPGLIARLEKCFPWIELPEPVDVRLFIPTTGGGGSIVADNAIEFAAVLANPIPHLPEIVRLGWLLATLGTKRLVDEVQLPSAMVIPTLDAAEFVELVTVDELTVQSALQEWLKPGLLKIPASEMMDWWQRSSSTASDVETWRESVRRLG